MGDGWLRVRVGMVLELSPNKLLMPCAGARRILHTSVFHSLEKELIPVADTLDLSKQELASVPGGYG